MVRVANDLYYNGKPVLDDNSYDILKEFVERKYPKNEVIKEVGAPVEKNKVELPYFMGSMDKSKPDTKALSSWKRKYLGPYVISAKLDGISGMYSTEGDEPKLYTRGNGRVGQDIGYMIPYLKLQVNRVWLFVANLSLNAAPLIKIRNNGKFSQFCLGRC